jgi:ribosomal-protein-alanine N-acetyltransferase
VTGATEASRVAGAGAVVLRDMRWWDLDAVLLVEHEVFEDAWSRGMFWSELADTAHPAATRRYIVAEAADGRIVGYAGLAAVAGTGDVQSIAVAREHWGTGLGARLLTELLRTATAAECREVLLDVRVDNARAQRLYQRFGFEPIGIRKGYYQPGSVDAVVMRLSDPAAGPWSAEGAAADDPALPADSAIPVDPALSADLADPAFPAEAEAETEIHG